jgi:hypothetical protein
MIEGRHAGLPTGRFAPVLVGREFSSGEVQTAQHAQVPRSRLSLVNLNF